MALTEAERALAQARLDEARAALHRLTIGQAEVSLVYNGESITYSAADAGRLQTYIRQLEAQLGLRSSARARSRGVIFG
ncbi:phage head-to-tail joining protein [Rhizobium etli 8C-3]|uniref:Phage head-to-tail joining protein n=1 Tax=Rhizobium etli 8C-3 TaxID=538025 RepID=A0A1L5P273_RHIET|nr:gpW family head-tail joining protein [Rhizobium etli]APO74259.1 phage head-to-tail joining protein [Rhizobium etli 8C-3]